MKFVWPVAILALLLVSPALQVAAQSGAAPAGGDVGHYYFGFEENAKPWVPVAEAVPDYSLTTVYGDNGCADPFGGLINFHYARLSSVPVTNGTRPTIPATWMEAGLRAGLGEFFVRVQWSARLDNKAPVTNGTQAAPNCQTCYPVAFIGTTAPQEGGQFKIADNNPLANSWRSYEYTKMVVPDEKGLVFVALGWNGTGMSIGMDCVDVTITPIVATAPTPTNQ
jgi:hypothetical protein